MTWAVKGREAPPAAVGGCRRLPLPTLLPAPDAAAAAVAGAAAGIAHRTVTAAADTAAKAAYNAAVASALLPALLLLQLLPEALPSCYRQGGDCNKRDGGHTDLRVCGEHIACPAGGNLLRKPKHHQAHIGRVSSGRGRESAGRRRGC